MEPFYKYALIIAAIFLIVCLIGIGILMQFQNSGMKFPLHPNMCPDRWTISNDKSSCNLIAANGTTSKTIALSTYPNICDKKKWAKDNNVNWDGVSNYNSCP